MRKNLSTINHQNHQLGSLRLSWSALIVLVVISTSLIFYVFQLFSSTADNQRAAKIFEQSLLASINQYEYLPALLARDDLVVNLLNKPEVDHTRLSNKLRFIALRSGATDLFLQDAGGTVVASSNYQQEKRNFYGKNYSFRPYFRKAKSERERQFYFAKGATTGIPGFFISAPVIKNDIVLGVMVVKLERNDWEDSWRDSNQKIVVADENGVIILSSIDEWRYQSIGDISEQQLQQIYEQKQFANEVHSPLYSQEHDLNFFGNKDSFYWKISDSAYLVNRFPLQDTNWTLYHLVKHNTILSSAVLFFIITSLLGMALYLLLRERSNKLELRRKARLIEKKRRYELQLLIDNIHIGVLVFSHNGRIMSMNNHAEHLLLPAGNEFTQLDGSIHVTDLIDIDISAADFDNYLLDDIATPAYHETVALSQDGENNGLPTSPIMFAIGKIEFADRKAYLMTVINIARRKAVEDELLQVNESLEETVAARTKELRDTQSALMQKNKAVALGNMAATIVHELSQPLAAINSSVAAIKAKVEMDNWSGANESVGRLQPLSNKMNNVIKLLKFFSYQDESQGEEVAFAKIIQQAVDVLQDSFHEQSIEVDYLHEHPNVMVRVNPIKIDLAVSNLLKNAIEAVENSKKPLITIDTELTNGMMVLHIEDNGGGVDEHIMGQLFNPYFTTKEVGKGMGLGLSITYEILQQYGGEISATNTHKGARFSISLPFLNNTEDEVSEEKQAIL